MGKRFQPALGGGIGDKCRDTQYAVDGAMMNDGHTVRRLQREQEFLATQGQVGTVHCHFLVSGSVLCSCSNFSWATLSFYERYFL